jgi:hypothetical protein
LMDSAASPKKKTSEGEGIGVCSLAHNTSKVEGRAGTLGWDSEDWQASHLLTQTYTN